MNLKNEQMQELGSINKVFPRSVASVSRAEFGWPEDNPQAKAPPLKLHIKDNQKIPLDLQGHVFIVGPAGSVNSTQSPDQFDSSIVFPSEDGTTLLYNGDGMIYRLDFDDIQQGVFLSTRLVKTPCYYADVATNTDQKYQDLKFNNIGIARLSGKLGIRNQLNTAFLPLKFAQDEHDRLLVTWDAGRPYEIDPKTLEAVTPVGKDSEWKEVNPISQLLLEPPPLFKTVQSSAHPVFDPNTSNGEMFTVNCGRSLENVFSQLLPLAYIFKELFEVIKAFWQKPLHKAKTILITLPKDETKPHKLLQKKLKISWKSLVRFFRALIGILFDDFVYLIRWDGFGDFQKWKVLHNGFPIKIRQSLHQMGITENYIILVDTAFKLSVEELLPPLKIKKDEQIEQLARNLLDHPQLSDNQVYIIHRNELQPGKNFVAAKKVTIPGEAAHFLVDYQNPSGRITMHLAQVCAWDAAECISKFDFKDFDNSSHPIEQSLQRLYGIIYGPVDISKFGCYVINGETGELLRHDTLTDVDYTWGPAVCTYRTHPFAEQLEDIYWICVGCWDELLKPHIVHLYEQYKYREVGMPLMDSITDKGRNSNLLRLHIAPLDSVEDGQNRLQIADAYQFPDGYTVGSPQFIPRHQQGSSTDGYIVCIVHYGDGKEETNGNEIWIFDAAELNSGPKCKLWHPQFNVGFTVHSTWLPKIERRTANYHVSMYDDYQNLINQQDPEIQPLIQDLFDHWVYPKREP